MIAVKKLDLEECEQEHKMRFYPSVVRMTMMHYITKLRHQLKMVNGEELIKLKMDKKEDHGDAEAPPWTFHGGCGKSSVSKI
ncbi:hypothetical protein J1P26_09065 [Neobacillus sp. MM2021_6]|uniref:hypothetical protein n=1 Tax=Bacillaceae TaxID=186817 RepID=UPI00140D7B28|nr:MULTISPECIES: hypothetical protein [Bacillaceae]MBO0959874.1 hypothetical protein [Neobacillus sp. MM2021_6]NHC20478.1 hypothetical protein [Bacillus sp. MM2020_4]